MNPVGPLLTTGLLAVCVSAHSAEPAASAVETELRRITQEMLDAVAPGNAEVWRRYLDDRVIHVDENGVVRTKEELLKEFSPLPPGLVGRMEIAKFKAAVHDDVAVVAFETQEYLDYHGQVLRSRFRGNDTWLKTAAGWRLISEQVAAVIKDPPSIKLSQAALCAYNGSYALTESIVATVRCTEDGLAVERTGRPPVTYVAELPDVFFVPGQARTRRMFQRDSRGAITGFVDRREGEDIRWSKRQGA